MNANRGGEDQVRVNGWLRGLGDKIGLPLRLDDDGVCAIGHTSGLDCAVEVPEGAGMLYLRVPLIPWPFGSPLLLAERCLTESFLGQSTGGASFAIDQQERQLVIWLSRPLSTLDEAQLGGLIVDFFETASAWKGELEALCHGEAMQENPRPEREQNFMRA